MTAPVTVDRGELGVDVVAVDDEVDGVEPVGADEPADEVRFEVVEPSVETADLSVLFSDDVVELTAPVTALRTWCTVETTPPVTWEAVPLAVFAGLDALPPAPDAVRSAEPTDGVPADGVPAGVEPVWAAPRPAVEVEVEVEAPGRAAWPAAEIAPPPRRAAAARGCEARAETAPAPGRVDC